MASDLTPKQIGLMKLAIPIFSALLVDDKARAGALLEAAGVEFQRVVDGLFMLAVALVSSLAGFKEQSVESTLQGLQPTEVTLIAEASVNWNVGIELVEAVRTGDPEVQTISAQMDGATALQTAMSIIVALLWALDGVGGHDGEWWLQQTGTWLLAGAPAPPEGWEPPAPL
jgi:hypothetical protein